MKISPPSLVNMKNTPPGTFQLFRPCDPKSVHQMLTVRVHFLTEAATWVNHMNLLQAGRDKGFAQKCVDFWWTVKIHECQKRLQGRKRLWWVIKKKIIHGIKANFHHYGSHLFPCRFEKILENSVCSAAVKEQNPVAWVVRNSTSTHSPAPAPG